MSDTGTVLAEMVKTLRLLRMPSEPNLVILRVETQVDEAFNFGMDLATFSHAVDVWRLDIDAVAAALKNGTAAPGKPLGTADKAAN